jgi:hypothetical protein
MMRRALLILGLLVGAALPAAAQTTTPPLTPPPVCQTGLQKDWKKAIWRAPLHILVSAPVAVGSLVIPSLGKAYVRARSKAEERDRARGSDTCMKAAIDLYTQTALVRATLRMYGIKTP